MCPNCIRIGRIRYEQRKKPKIKGNDDSCLTCFYSCILKKGEEKKGKEDYEQKWANFGNNWLQFILLSLNKYFNCENGRCIILSFKTNRAVKNQNSF